MLLRARGVPVGLVTDGRWWALVWAPLGGTTAAAVWDGALWSEEPESLRAFVGLLHTRRFLGVAPSDTLPALLPESLGAQEEVTETLGAQVRDAVELLVETLDEADERSGVLAGVSDDDLYESVVSFMMRLVFLLFAEERRLLPSDDDTYAASYSVGQLHDRLDADARLAGDQALEHRYGAWHRLLAVSRAVYAGVAHEDLRLPAYGSSLFDPDRFPWLEGRRPGMTGDGDPAARPPDVSDRTVLRLLRAVQYVEICKERRRLTFRALDVEQIGYVYEGLLELEVRTAREPVLGLVRPPNWPRKAKEPSELPLSQAQEWLAEVPPRLAPRLAARLGTTESQVVKRLAALVERQDRAALHRRLPDRALVEQVLPLAPVLRWDDLGRPAVTLPGRRYVAPSTRRAATGTHYTPRSLAEDVANNALEPLCYRPGPLETRDRSTWRIRPSADLLALRVADIAMGSGAFLVAACRYLADRLVDAWVDENRSDAVLARERQRKAGLTADAEVEEVALAARRLVAEHCLYGVDINPLAVEMAKLSLWLVTMDRERPFGFLDDRFVAGDSLLGLVSRHQLLTLHAHPDGGPALLDQAEVLDQRLRAAADERRRITSHPVLDLRDAEVKAGQLRSARGHVQDLTHIADAVTGVGLHAAGLSAKQQGIAFKALLSSVEEAHQDYEGGLAQQRALVHAGTPLRIAARTPLHWPLVFPEVFGPDAADPGFDAIIGNPPFLGGQKHREALGPDYAKWLQVWDGRGVKGSADLAARFVLRAERLLNIRGQLGYITTNTLVQGDTLQVGLAEAVGRGLVLRRGRPSHPWPSESANLEIVDLWASRARVAKDGHRWLDGEDVSEIGADLEPVGRVRGRPRPLPENQGTAFQGSNVVGLGFTLNEEQALALMDRNPRDAEVLQPYIIGQDLNQRPDCSASRWIINFHDWPLERARQYPEPFEIVERLVKPERDRNNRQNYRERWWQYGETRPGLYGAIADLDHVLAIARVSSSVAPVRVPVGPVYSEKVVVVASDALADLAVMASSAHLVWTLRYTSTLRTDINYAPSDVFLTLPRPESTPDLEKLGERLDTERRDLMLSRTWGLTTTYNHVHDPSDRDPAVVALRDLHTDIDHAVLAAYGWDDLDPEVGHHPTKIGTRWTVSPNARFELLDRLLEENQSRERLRS